MSSKELRVGFFNQQHEEIKEEGETEEDQHLLA